MRLEEDLIKCMKCGVCLAFCPIYKETKLESTSARGKIALAESLLENKINLTSKFSEKFSLCLFCLNCVKNCPSGVEIDKIVQAIRNYLVEQGKISLFKKLIFNHLLKYGTILFLLTKMGYVSQKIFFPIIPEYLKNYLSYVPNFPSLTFKEQVEEKIKVENPKLKVAFFVGCATNFIYPEIGFSLINFLKNSNIEVVIPKSQRCCGTPFFKSGFLDIGKENAEYNIKIFSKLKVDAIVAACASCGLTLKNEYKEFDKNFSKNIYDISEFIEKGIGLKNLKIKEKKSKGKIITYHDPCHLKRGQDIFDEPRKIIKSIPNFELIEMKESDSCCGSGGTFTFFHHKISLQILNKKLKNIEETNADYVVTSCPACIMQIRHGIIKENKRQKVMHIVQLLD